MELLNLQNGSDIRGAAMGEHAVLTPDAVRRIGCSFGEWIKRGPVLEPGLQLAAIPE